VEEPPALDAATSAVLMQPLAVMLAHGGPVEEQVAVLEQLWRVQDPYTAGVSRRSQSPAPSKVGAKAARKASFRLASARRT
jgi:hypothetical protein